ncbi:MAG: fatty acid hydroxylase [Flavobacteriaceae bacterium]|nr:MAG: fatty acid hydroxylase [Flavobacteriaceae bacterium]
MNIIDTVLSELMTFFGIEAILKIIESGDYSKFLTSDGIISFLFPLFPLILIIEFIVGLVNKNPHTKVYKINFLIYIFNRIISRFLSLGVTGFALATFPKYAFFQTTFTWYWFVYAYVVFEFSHFTAHFLSHKVRLLWCIHSTHHTPENMNLSVNHAHFFLEDPYIDFLRPFICLLAGVHPELFMVTYFIDGFWGIFIHIGENLIKDGRMGIHKIPFLGKYLLSPSDHRVHHARNPLYMDTNYSNLLNIWDRLFGTYQPIQEDIKIEYGITRSMDSGNFWDVYFGEIWALMKDVFNAPSLKAALLYLVMPPGWSPTGNHQTSQVVKKAYLEGLEKKGLK